MLRDDSGWVKYGILYWVFFLAYITPPLASFPKLAVPGKPLPFTEELLLEVLVNDHPTKIIAHALLKENLIYLSERDLQNLRINPQKFARSFDYCDISYYEINSAPEMKYTLDMMKLQLHIHIPPYLLEETVINCRKIPEEISIAEKATGGFLNYGVVATHHDTKQLTFAALPELGIFTKQGIGTTSFLLNTKNRSHEFIRLNTALVHDDPPKMQRWLVGDTFTRAADWGGVARLGGIQWGTAFSTQPTFVTFPLPSFSTTAALPSTVDVFVENSLKMRQNVESGPVRIENLPIIAGQGIATVVTTDLLGRETITFLPYNSTKQLLKPELEDFSVEIGATRENFGFKSANYNQFASALTYYRGITPTWTAGAHSEIEIHQQNFGVSTRNAIGNLGIIAFSVAGSYWEREKKTGALLSTSYQYLGDPLSFTLSTVYSTESFRTLCLEKSQKSPKFLHQAFLGYGLGYLGSIGATFTYQQRRTETNIGLVTFSYQTNLPYDLFFSVGNSTFITTPRCNQVFAMLTWSLGEAGSMSTLASRHNHATQESIQINKAVPPGIGYGYQLNATNNNHTHGSPQFFDGMLAYQNTAGEYFGRIKQSQSTKSFQAGATGSLIAMNHKIFPARQTRGSFTLVQVPKFSDVHIYRDNLDVGVTDEDGDLLVPELTPYVQYMLRAEAKDLPLSAELDEVQTIVAAPYRAGVVTQLKIVKSQAILLKLMTENQSCVPPGALVEIVGEENPIHVGFDGQVYINKTSPYDNIQGQATWGEKQCYFNVEVPKNDEPIKIIDTVMCQARPISQ